MHNGYTFLRREFARANLAFAAPTLCTVQLSRRLYPEYFKHSLDSIIERFDIGIDASERHRAMGDVHVLIAFLQRSLHTHGAEHWLAQWNTLIKPSCLPSWLPMPVRDALYRLPDSPGISIWHHPGHQQNTVLVHDLAFSNTASLLRQPGAADRWQHTSQVTFIRAISVLHAHALQAAQWPSPSAHTETAAWYTVEWVANHQGQLQARVVPLQNGLRNQRPYGLFAHPRGAKRALAIWAQDYGLCPASLAISTQSMGKNQPCPRQEAGLCDGDCRTEAGIIQHNQAIMRAAMMLPVCDWGSLHELEITETDAWCGQTTTLHCAAASIEVAEGQWYFHDALPRIFKQRLKNKVGIKVLN